MGFDKDALVAHPRFGRGRVRVDEGETVVVRFDDGIQECLGSELERIHGVAERSTARQVDPALPVVARILANAILSVNDAWGVLSRSRINLLPHQLWVCRRVLEDWPTRWLVADDVGLGKTIEAGLILTPLLSAGRVRRLLIVAPASLVEQWQVRMRTMFDIRLSTYASESDGPRSDFWNTHDKVVASAQTLRLDKGGRWDRLLQAEPWDLVMVDEAHHLNATDDGGRTLAFQLVERLQQAGRVRSMVFFTGTPHRGKDHGFLSLLNLLRPGEFDPRQALEDQVARLRGVMIRNNKQRVTDMAGQQLFTPVVQHLETYAYSPEEAAFYGKLTEFIATGKAYAAGLGRAQARTAILVLITMQKLASSSVAAVRRALRNRLDRLKTAAARMSDAQPELDRLQELMQQDDPADADEVARLEEKLLENLADVIHLNPNEIPALEELLAAADAVTRETKLERILEVVEQRFPDRSVLFFTEYKATQAKLMSSLQARYGDGCVTFINGDGFIEVVDQQGQPGLLRGDRERAARRFNRGEVRFLVSTEAAGEGIDLQERCSALMHVDLPWNPMRLHQRVGRLSRYGQTEPVEVITIRNPDTVESRIWDCLDQKLDRITLAFQGGMDDPEDMRQLVLGMASPRMFTQVFADADPALRGQRLEQWFDARTATFGGEEAVSVVRQMFGNVARFDFGEVADQIPRVDLPDLLPYFKAMLTLAGKRPNQVDEVRLSFKTPRPWASDFTIAEQYDLLFSRQPSPGEGEDVAGVGHRIVDRALQIGVGFTESLAVVGDLEHPLFVFALRDRITGSEGAVRRAVVGVQKRGEGWHMLRDWEVIGLLNSLADRPRSAVFQATPQGLEAVAGWLSDAEAHVRSHVDDLDLPFRLPQVESLAALLPGVL